MLLPPGSSLGRFELVLFTMVVSHWSPPRDLGLLPSTFLCYPESRGSLPSFLRGPLSACGLVSPSPPSSLPQPPLTPGFTPKLSHGSHTHCNFNWGSFVTISPSTPTCESLPAPPHPEQNISSSRGSQSPAPSLATCCSVLPVFCVLNPLLGARAEGGAVSKA